MIGCAIRVHRDLAPGSVENVYRRATEVELGRESLFVEREKGVVVNYADVRAGWHRLDFLIEEAVVWR